MYDGIALFIHIAQQGGLGNAAKHLGLPPATVTRRLQKLEYQLGINCCSAQPANAYLPSTARRYTTPTPN